MSTFVQAPPYVPKNKIRVVTAASLFDGHDAAINIMRRIIQSTGAEVIHLGHDRSVEDVVNTAIQEDAHAIAMTSYQGGHTEYFKYMHDLLKEKGAGHIKIFGGGGGTILPEEIKELHEYGITRLYHPDDGRAMGLQGMINDMLEKADFDLSDKVNGEAKELSPNNWPAIAKLISTAENHPDVFAKIADEIHKKAEANKAPILGITGTGGAGKSSMVDELIRRFILDQPTKTIGVISVDPSKRKTGGALLGDRIRMNSIRGERVYMRSLATRQSNLALSKHVKEAVSILKAAGFDLIVLETSGIGQSDTEILDHSDVSLYIMTPEFGAATQLEKIDMLDFADVVAINKFDKRGALDAVRDVKKQYKRNHQLWDADDDTLPVVGTIASQFNDPGTNNLYVRLMETIKKKTGVDFHSTFHAHDEMSEKVWIIPPAKSRYLSEISENNRRYDAKVDAQAEIADKLYGLHSAILTFGGPDMLTEASAANASPEVAALVKKFDALKKDLDPHLWAMISGWKSEEEKYGGEFYTYLVRGKEIKVPNHTESLSHLKIPKVALPKFRSWGDKVRWAMQENTPGFFPYTAGIYPFKRQGEDPARMFAGEGGPERTNKRFHYVSQGLPAKRLSTAFDSVTLYGHDPGRRPDIYGKVGNSGVSICCLDDAKKLYSGFDLSAPTTSVSMTINGPAPMLLGFFMNAAIDQNCEKYIREHKLESVVEEKIQERWAASREPRATSSKTGSSSKLEARSSRPQYHGEVPAGNDGLGLMLLGITGDQVLPPDVYAKIKADTLAQVRGTVQADILKEDQAQNTCIFSTEFALRLMGDVQQYFIDKKVRNFYSVSISGYHIAEAGANPISQLAFTLANGFTYVEYYLSRGMDINAFAPNLSFFFSNGMNPEYAVMGRVARRLWAKALKHRYGADERSQLLKYHIQTSGRSLHAQEIDFNDIRTTLQALYAIYDNCNSLHTNAYDEAITTPTEESVRRAMAIQLIINRELGLAKNENPLQGSFIIEELTDLVEEAVLTEFDRITERGGVLGAMETMYQRSRIQEESLYYETLKHTGEYPIIGVNTFLSSKGSPTILPKEVIRATEEEKEAQIATVENLRGAYADEAAKAIKDLQQAAIRNENMFEVLMEATKYCSLGQLTAAMFEVGGSIGGICKLFEVGANMRILKVIHGYPPLYSAGSEVYSQSICEELSKRHEVVVFSREENPFAPDMTVRITQVHPGLSVHLVNMPRAKDGYRHAELDARFAELVRAFEPDVAHIGHLNHLSTGIMDVLEKAGIPVVFTLHDFWLMCPRGQFLQRNFGQGRLHELCDGQEDRKCATTCYSSAFSGVDCRISDEEGYWSKWVATRMDEMHRLASAVDLFIAPSRYLRTRFIDEFGVDASKVMYLDYGFPTDYLVTTTKRDAYPKFRFGYIGTHIPAKGVNKLIEAFDGLGDAAELYIWGAKDQQSTAALQAIGRFSKGIHFMGAYVNQNLANEVFNRVDCIVVPSIWMENSPLVIHEAQACGIPVITAEAGGMAEYVQHQVNGLLFKHRSMEDLREHMRWACTHPNEMERLGSRGYLFSTTGAVPSIVDHCVILEDVYTQLIARS